MTVAEKPTYTVYVKTLERSVEFPCPRSLPQAGDSLRVRKPFLAASGFSYYPGDRLLLLSRTEEDPHGYCSSLGNWMVECINHISVWSNIELMLAEGTLE